jgi:hypothetical protein
MTAINHPPVMPPPKGRMLLGGGVLVAGQFSPLFIPLVVSSSLSAGLKSALSGLLLLGIPELAILSAIAILGKPGFTYLKQRLFALLRRAAPIDTVSLVRYRIGLVLFCGPLLVGWAAPYVSDLIPHYGRHQVAIGVAGDGLLVLSLFVLGGDFWDKLRSLFVRDARALFPKPTSNVMSLEDFPKDKN